MARLLLRNVDKKAGPGEWELILGRGRTLLSDPGGIIAADFEITEAHKRFQLPSFWASIKKLGIRTDQQKAVKLTSRDYFDSKNVVWFEPEKEALAEIRHYLAYALAAQGEGAISTARWKGWGMVFVGITMLLVGIALMIFMVIHDTNNPRPGAPRFYAPVGAIIVGGGLLGGGIAMLRRAHAADTEWLTSADDEPELEEDE